MATRIVSEAFSSSRRQPPPRGCIVSVNAAPTLFVVVVRGTEAHVIGEGMTWDEALDRACGWNNLFGSPREWAWIERQTVFGKAVAA